jgi:hypothetical protein
MMLVVLVLCITLVVILNMLYMPKLATAAIEYSSGNLVFQISDHNAQTSGVSMDKLKEWSHKRKVAKEKFVSATEKPTNAIVAPTTLKPESKAPDSSTSSRKIAGLNCDRFGGPSEEIAAEMVYWRDIPNDAQYHSPYANYGQSPKYLTFEPDEGGWNNIRMSMETATTLAHAMGRILVLPPEQNMYLLNKDKRENNRFTFHHFFPFDAISEEHPAVEVISMDEFLQREVLSGNLKNSNGNVVFPPGNQTIFEGHVRDGKTFWDWWRNVTNPPIWDFSTCVAGIAKEPGSDGASKLTKHFELLENQLNDRSVEDYINKPTPVDAPPVDRLREILAHRKKVCVYDDYLQNTKVMHFMGDNDSGARLLVHFYAFLFFEDWKQDLWTKRYVRDHLRYVDDIQCAAAKIVHAVREKARENGNPDGLYDSMHIRRGDFQYKETRIEAEEILANIQDIMPDNTTLFIATDEKNLTFFRPLISRYRVYFLHDFLSLVPDLNKNYYGMLDQRIASRGRTFAGAYFSTFTGYINRQRGYHSQKEKLQGWKEGTINSYYYVEKRHKNELVNYYPIKGPMWSREFPVAWRDIDHDVHPSHIVA